jgi:hypothetical protein
MVFVEYADDVDGARVLGNGNGEDRSSRETEAAYFLLRELRDGEWHKSADVKARAEAEGIKERTLHRARKELGVEDDRTNTVPAFTIWRLPRSCHVQSCQRAPQVMAQLAKPHR